MDVQFRESFPSLWPPTASEMRERQDLAVVFVFVVGESSRSEKQLLLLRRDLVVVFVFVVRSSGGSTYPQKG